MNKCRVYLDFCILNYDSWVEGCLNKYTDGFRRKYRCEGVPDEYSVFDRELARSVPDDNRVNHIHGSVHFGGGVKSDADVESAFNAGAAMVTVGSLAVTSPDRFAQWLQTYGPERLILGADARDGKISINGWKEDSTQELLPFLQSYWQMGVTQVLCTDISRDGMLSGPSVGLYRSLLESNPACRLIASGGVSSIGDLWALDEAGVPAVVVGKAIYEGRIDLAEVSKSFNS